MIFGYSRVSTSRQNADSQSELLLKEGCDEILIETHSGANRRRPELERLLSLLREGDLVIVAKLDRLSRSLRDPLIDTTTPNGKLVFGIFAVCHTTTKFPTWATGKFPTFFPLGIGVRP